MRAWLSRRAVARSAYDVVIRGATSLALILEALWIGGSPQMWPWRQEHLAQTAALAFVFVAWAILLATQAGAGPGVRRAARLANVLALAAAATIMLTGVLQETASWAVASDLALLCAGAAGLLLGVRVSVGMVTLVVVAEAVTVVISETTATDLLYPAFTLVVGVASISARAALIREARLVDAAWSASVRLEAERRIREEVETAMRQHERALHATVLNTLTAIERGGLAGELRPRLATRCREAARVLCDLRRESTEPAQAGAVRQALDRDVAAGVDDLRAAGTRVDVDVDPMDAVPAAAYLSVRAAVQEALANTLRHAHAQSCRLTGRVVGSGPDMSVDVVVEDDGIGFDTGTDAGRYGLVQAIAGPMGEIGGSATVRSVPGHGTRIELHWQDAGGAGAPGPYTPSAMRLAVPTLTAFGLFACASALATVADAMRPALDIAALAVLLGCYALVAHGSRRGSLAPWLVSVAVIGGVVAFELQQLVETQTGAPWADWSSMAVAMLFFVVAGVGPRWAWAVVIVAWLLIQGDVLHELTSAGTAVLVAGALYGRSTRRNAGAVESARMSERTQTVALAVADASVRRMRGRYAPLAESDAIDLLDGVAAGVLDPDDPGVRRRAAVEERFIRNLIRVDPQADPLLAVTAEVMRAGRRAGVLLTCDVGAARSEASGGLDALRTSLLSAIGLAVPGSEARLTARLERDGLVVRLTVLVEQGRTASAVELPVPGFPVEPLGPDGQQMLWEWREPREQTTALGPVARGPQG